MAQYDQTDGEKLAPVHAVRQFLEPPPAALHSCRSIFKTAASPSAISRCSLSEGKINSFKPASSWDFSGREPTCLCMGFQKPACSRRYKNYRRRDR